MNRFKGEAGFTLLELMVAMAMSSLVIIALGSAFLAQNKAYRINDQVVDLQQDLRNVFEDLVTDITSAGAGLQGMSWYLKGSPCNSSSCVCTLRMGVPVNIAPSGTTICPSASNRFNTGVFGLKLDSVTEPALLLNGVDGAKRFQFVEGTASQKRAGLDGSNRDSSELVKSAITTFTFKYPKYSGTYVFAANDYILVSDYDHPSIFKVTAVDTSNSTYVKLTADKVGLNDTDANSFGITVLADETNSSNKSYVTFAYEPQISFIGLFKTVLYHSDVSDSNKPLRRGDGFMTQDGTQILRLYAPRLSFELAYSTASPNFRHIANNWTINPDMCGSTLNDDKVVVAAKVNMVARTSQAIGGNDLAGSEQMGYGSDYTMEYSGSPGQLSALSGGITPYYYRLVSAQVDLKNLYGLNQGAQNDYLANVAGCTSLQ